MSPQIHIFLRTESAMRRELWRTFLSTPTQVCVSEFADLPSKAPIDVVVTDQAMDEESRAKLATGQGAGPNSPAVFDGGVISVGLDEDEASASVAPQDPVVGPSSVSLPGSATARELKLGVLLVNQIVQLNRERSAQSRLSDSYQEQALQDPLTSIANRRAWEQELAARWDRWKASPETVCLALFDVDQLKRVNDLVGHAEGDTVLRAIASALAGSVRDLDFAARLGGDEFGIFLEGVDPDDAQQIVDRIRCSTSRYLATGQAGPNELPVTTSAGYACLQSDDSADSLYRRADEALRASKQGGNNRTTGL